MERLILFRGKPIDKETIIGDDFFVGDLVHYANGKIGIRQQETGSEMDINPETIGQFTGQYDKNKTKIFEGDIVKFQRQLPIYNMFENDEYGGEIVDVNHKVEYFNHGTCFELVPLRYYELMNEGIYCNHLIEVVGNVFDNPELI